jgi:hypothetical protein
VEDMVVPAFNNPDQKNFVFSYDFTAQDEPVLDNYDTEKMLSVKRALDIEWEWGPAKLFMAMENYGYLPVRLIYVGDDN